MKKKLIEVALPLAEINDASAYDKMPGIGPHPKGIHQWWARLPLPTARAVLFASVVDDPSSHPDKFPTENAQSKERDRLFGIFQKLMQKKLHEHPEVYAEAKKEMLKHCGGKLPPVLDPFAGGGSIPLEANRLGFEAHAGDLNPIAVLLNKCNLEIAPRWAGHAPINPDAPKLGGGGWRGTHGLAEDVRYYGKLIREEAIKKIGHLYPKVRLPKAHGGGEAPVIAWLWARTVASPNPVVGGAHVPLITTYWLSSKKGQLSWIKPIVDRRSNTYRFEVHTGDPDDKESVKSGTKLGRGSNFQCLLSGSTIESEHIRKEATEGHLGMVLTCVVVDGGRKRVYVHDENDAPSITAPEDQYLESGEVPQRLTGGTCYGWGLRKWSSLFTPRQLTAMTTLSDFVKSIRKDVIKDAKAAKMKGDDAESYADAVQTFLALALDRCADFNNSLCRWSPTNQKVMNLFGRQAIPMVWDFAEANILGESVGAWKTCSDYVADCIEVLGAGATAQGQAQQDDAAHPHHRNGQLLVSTDPPYYDNIGYAALSDFFYVWLRRTIGDRYSDLFGTVLVPKMPELTATPEKFGGDKEKAKDHFESGFRSAFAALRDKMDPALPLTVYYAFKQEEETEADEDGESSGITLTTGWETLLEALISTGFQITATWPIRASQAWRMVSMGTNALASYIVLACRQRPPNASLTSRKDFLGALKRELPTALRNLQHGNIAPVDLAQASIGPGMAVFSRYSKVVESDGTSMRVRTALSLINQTLDEVLAEQEGEFDADTRWALAWFEQHGMDNAAYGEAETLSKAKNTSIQGLEEAGLLNSKAGKVRLLKRDELPKDWNPTTDKRLTVWEVTQQLIRRMESEGEQNAAALVKQVGAIAEQARDLAYRLYTVCEKKKWSQEALPYNALVIAWPELIRQAQSVVADKGAGQGELGI